MTVRDELRSAVETLSDEESARVLGYVEAIAERRGLTNGTPVEPSAAEDEDDDELTRAVPKLGFAPGSGLWDLMGFIKDDGPTDMAENHDKYLAEADDDLHEER